MNTNAPADDSVDKLRQEPADKNAGWNNFSEVERRRPGFALLERLIQKADSQGKHLKELADALGVTYGYIAQLRSGTRRMKDTSDEFVEAAARFLVVPKLSIKVWAGKIDISDLTQPPEALDRRLDNALTFIAADALLGCWIPDSVKTMTPQEKFFVVLCFQHATGYELLEQIPSSTFIQDYLKGLPGY